MNLRWLPLLLGTLLVSAIITAAVRRIATRAGALDRPNERSAHSDPKPRLGGIAIFTAFGAAASISAAEAGARWSAWAVLGATTGIALLGLADDLKPIPAKWRLAFQALAAGLVVFACQERLQVAWQAPWLGLPVLAILTVIWIVWMTNLFNFMDGIDGLAAGQAIIGGIALALVASRGAGPFQVALLVALVGSHAGFLVWNFPPSKIFMGDVGSTATGFFFACVPLLPDAGSMNVEVVAISVGLFVLDATSTLLVRGARGQPVFQAHRMHLYQRPLAMGMEHLPIVLTAYLAMAVVAGAAIAYDGASTAARSGIVAFVLALFASLWGLVKVRGRRLARLPKQEP